MENIVLLCPSKGTTLPNRHQGSQFCSCNSAHGMKQTNHKVSEQKSQVVRRERRGLKVVVGEWRLVVMQLGLLADGA